MQLCVKISEFNKIVENLTGETLLVAIQVPWKWHFMFLNNLSKADLFFLLSGFERESSDMTRKQTRQSMETVKALQLDKTIECKEERDRYDCVATRDLFFFQGIVSWQFRPSC